MAGIPVKFVEYVVPSSYIRQIYSNIHPKKSKGVKKLMKVLAIITLILFLLTAG